MKATIVISVLVAALFSAYFATRSIAQNQHNLPAGRFEYLDIDVDSGQTPLAAWQIELVAPAQAMQIVGVESGDAKDFQDPPYYDPAALSGGRIVIGAFNTTDNLPAGNTRVARLHVRISQPGRIDYQCKLIVAGSQQGNAIPARVSVREGAAQ